MPVRINEIVPDFSAETDHGKIQFHDWIGDGWVIMFSHPRDFTGVCTTEMSAVAQLGDEWAQRNTKVIGVSADGIEQHSGWKHDIEKLACRPAEFSIIADQTATLAKTFEMLPAEAYQLDGTLTEGARTVRSLFIIGPDKKLKLSMFYPAAVGRNWAEVVRALDALQAVATHAVAMPANWALGEDVIIPSAISDAEAKIRFGGFDAVLPYVRTTKMPE
jgi:alkyl hydroperoxide reductase subunit AhpC